MSDYQTRFGGIARLYGTSQSDVLQNAHCCVIGIGGVGSWIAEALARSGIGAMTLIDLDEVCTTNTNRQIHANSNTVGQSKVTLMAQRIKLINPECKVVEIEDFIEKDNLAEYLGDRQNPKFDLVFDAIDSIKAKTDLIAYCHRNKMPMVVTGGAGGQLDPSQIQYGDLAKTTHDPLLSKVRNQLRRDYNFTSNPKRKFNIDCVYSTEQLRYPQPDGQVCQQKVSDQGAMKLDCNTGFGAATMVTGSFGFFAAAKGVSKLLARHQRLAQQEK